MDDRTTDDKPAGWRGQLTVSDDDWNDRRGFYMDYVHDNALVAALEADGYTVTIQDDTTDKEDE